CTTPGRRLFRYILVTCCLTRVIAMRLVDLRGHGYLFGNGPHEADQFPGKSDDALVYVFPAGEQLAIALAEPHLGLPADILEDFGLFFASQWSMPTDLCRVSIGPGALDQRTPGRSIAGFGNRALPAPWPPGGLRGSQAQIIHELSGVVEAREVPQ